MEKKIYVDVNLRDEEARKKLKELENGKYKIDVDVNSDGADKTTKNLNELSYTAKHSQTVFEKFKNTIGNLFSVKNIAFTAYLAVLNEIRSAASNTKQEINDLDKSVTDLSVAMGQGRDAAEEYLKQLNEQAQDMGATTKEVADSADSWLRQGKSVKETGELVYDSMMLSKLGQIESADASTYLTSALNGYKKSASEAINIVDKLTAVDMESASDAGGLAESMSKTASAADMAGVSMDKLIGMIATVKEVTQGSDESVGNMFKSVFSRMNQIKAGKFVDLETGESLNDTEKVLNKVGIAMRDANGQFISSEKIMDAVGAKWSDFDSVTQRAVATAMAGTYQYNKLIALFNNYNKALDYTKVSAESAGTAIEKFNSSYKESLEAKTNTLQASFESMIMNSDMNEVYGNILDATTALVKFVDETNALKGALTGLATFAGIKAFMSIKTGATEAYIELNKFTNAVKIASNTNITTAEFDKLLVLSDGLSKKQMKLVLSTNSLTVAQKKQLLIASGLSEEESVATLQAWKMSAANNGLTASTTSASNAFKGLWLTLKANPLILITSAITIGVSAWQKYKQSIEEINQTTSDAASTYKSQSSSIEEYISKYQELHKQLIAAKGNEEETANVKSQLLDLQKQLNEEFGDEYGKINLVTDAYKDQTEAIKAYNKETANTFLNENRKGIKIATDKMTEDNTYSLGTMNGLVNADELDILEKIKEIASDNGIEFTSSGFEFVGNAEEAEKAINAFMDSLKELQKQSGNTSETMSGIFDGLLDNSGEALNKADSIISEYQEKYQQARLAEIASNDSLSVSYNKVIDAVQKYNDATSNSEDPYNDENVKSAYENLKAIQKEISDSSDWDNYRNVIDQTFEEADTKSYDFYNSIKNNEDGLSDLASQLQGMTATDIQSMIDDGDNGDAFDTLSQKAEDAGLSVDDLIDVFEKLGIVIDDTSNTVDSTEAFELLSTDTLQQQISDLNSAIDSIQSAYDTLNSAVEEYNTNGGTLSIDTIQSLLSLSDEYLACLQVENGQLSLNADAMAQLAQAKLDDAQATAVTQAMTELQAIANGEAAQSTTNYITGNAALMNSLAQLSGSYDGVAQAAMTAAQAQRLSAQISAASAKDKTATENVMKGLDNKLKMIQITKKSISAGHFGTVAKKASSSRSGSKSGSGGSGSGNSAKDAEKEAEEYVDKYMSYQKAMLEGGKTDYQTYTKNVKSMLDDMYNSGKISAKKYFSSVKDMIDEQKTIYEKALKAVTSRLEKEIDLWQAKIDALKKENDKLNDQKDTYDGILSAVEDVIDAETDRYQNLIDNLDKANDKLNESKDDKDGILSAISAVYDEQIDALNKQSDALDDQIQKLQDTNDELDKQYQKGKAIYALEQAQRLRNKKVYMDGKGYIYTQDQEAIRDAKKDLSDIETDEAISKLEKEKEKLSDAISNLEKYKELWAEVSNAYEKETNKQLAIAQYGKDFEKIILLNRESDINAFKNSYIAIQKELDNNQSLIDSYNEKVEYYNKLKEQWSSISNAYDVNANKQAAIAQWGSGFEQMILSGRIQNINAFKDQYLAIQSQINNNEQLINSYNEKVDYYNKLKDQWGNTTSVYEDELNAQYAAQVLGAGWETNVLNGRLDVMRKFTNEYKALCQQQADYAINAANAEVTARNNANSGAMSGGSDVGSGVSGGSSAPISSGGKKTIAYIVVDLSGNQLYSSTNQTTAMNWIKHNGYVVSRTDNQKATTSVVYFYVRKNTRGGGGGNTMHLARYSEGGIVTASRGTLVTNYDNPLNVIAQSMGEDTMIAAKKGERILTPEQNEMWERWTKAMPKLMSYLPNIEYDLDKTNASELKGNNKTVNLNQNVTIQCPNVTNTNGAEYIVKFLRSASADALVYSKK